MALEGGADSASLASTAAAAGRPARCCVSAIAAEMTRLGHRMVGRTALDHAAAAAVIAAGSDGGSCGAPWLWRSWGHMCAAFAAGGWLLADDYNIKLAVTTPAAGLCRQLRPARPVLGRGAKACRKQLHVW